MFPVNHSRTSVKIFTNIYIKVSKADTEHPLWLYLKSDASILSLWVPSGACTTGKSWLSLGSKEGANRSLISQSVMFLTWSPLFQLPSPPLEAPVSLTQILQPPSLTIKIKMITSVKAQFPKHVTNSNITLTLHWYDSI